jgi:hypothetical protein
MDTNTPDVANKNKVLRFVIADEIAEISRSILPLKEYRTRQMSRKMYAIVYGAGRNARKWNPHVSAEGKK